MLSSLRDKMLSASGMGKTSSAVADYDDDEGASGVLSPLPAFRDMKQIASLDGDQDQHRAHTL
eukprot:1644626-Rhodomonas_salina.2